MDSLQLLVRCRFRNDQHVRWYQPGVHALPQPCILRHGETVFGWQREDEVVRVKDLHFRSFSASALLVVSALSGAAFATASVVVRPVRTQAGALAFDSAGSHIWFEADATMGRFQGVATRVSGWATVADSFTFEGGQGRVEIDVASFKTGNGMRDGHLRGDMQAERYPQIVFEATEVIRADPALVDSALTGIVRFSDTIPAARVIIRGRLTIRDSTLTVDIPARARFSADSLRVRGCLATRFTEFGMKPPSRILGTVKVKDDIVLLFDALFKRPT